ncbi:MAG: choice-of-anchor tandem repeat GloVer-containing protein [Terriglobales bacterium]|jgi:uncharacterized repeat protein (TIGR03803 family)
MLRKLWFTKRSATLAPLILGLLLGAAWAQTETALYSFKGRSDGKSPLAGVVFDQKGNLYGTTSGGGLYNEGCYGYDSTCGVVFEITPEGQETVLYAFCAKANCTDGDYPSDAPVFDQKGSLYGTTLNGGAHGQGVVFKLAPDGKETVLHSFCAKGGTNCTDGALPAAPLVFDQKGNLYGTTAGGGAHSFGVVFKLSPKGVESVLYSFCAKGGTHCTDGSEPYAGLTFDRSGNLYGMTTVGGSIHSCGLGCGDGVVFKLTPEGKETVLYTFCTLANCADGSRSGEGAGVIFDQEGNLYGTTIVGGRIKSECVYGCGVVFKLTPEGKEIVLYKFCALTNCTDGWDPDAGVIFDQKGNLYGTTGGGGFYNNKYCRYGGCGVAFKLAPNRKETVLHTFCAKGGTNCSDGANPSAGIIFDRKGNLYGTTALGGGYSSGVVFKVTP